MLEKLCREIVATGQKIAQNKMVEGCWGNISARQGEHLAITPSGRDYDTLTVQDICILDLNGQLVQSQHKPSSELALHLAIYQARPDIKAVIHTHSVYASACAVANRPILPVMEDVVQIAGGQVDVAEYALAGTNALAQNTVLALGDKNAVLLARHGLVACGRNLPEALTVANVVEKTAMIMIFAQQLEKDLRILSEEDIKILRSFYLEKYSKIQLVEEEHG